MPKAERNSEEAAAVSRLIMKQAMRALRDASKPQYDAYLYVEILGFRQSEAATILGVSQQAVGKNLDAARRSIRAFLNPGL